MTAGAGWGFSRSVKAAWKRGVMIMSLVLAGQGVSPAEQTPEALMAEAVAATRQLGNQVMRGNYSYTIQQMYPRWKVQAAKRIGGMDKLVKLLAEVPKEMKRNGITILSFEPGVPEKVFEVSGVVGRTAEGKEFTVFTEWLVLVPTTTKYLVIEGPETGNQGKKRHLMTTGYQVAVKKKGTQAWYFIDGSSLKIAELRRTFPSLPATKEAMKLPEVGGLKEFK